MPNYLPYDTIIWALISLLLVLAWGIGLLLLLYLPYKRYVLKRDILSRQLFVTDNKIVYKAIRPSYLPFMGIVKKEIKVPLHLIVDVIIEQGCLQSAYSLYTFRIESIAHGKPAPVDELQFHCVHNPDFLRKVKASPIRTALDSKGKIPDNILLHKIEELNRSVKNLESLLVGSHRRE
ncbi:unnamed protein product [Miscanthus lutarioriparius]|uniref:DUF7642 domain-containing protein n=1 Tax=Miscanthus lutarioriparius TaxID=422564 RepID=A0A811PEH4_9POAL|nr:unnamed protein product [Miscanthus lutarioriparius]